MWNYYDYPKWSRIFHSSKKLDTTIKLNIRIVIYQNKISKNNDSLCTVRWNVYSAWTHVQALAKQMAELQRPGLLKASRACNLSDAIDTQLSSLAPPRFSRILGVNVPAYKYLPARIAPRFASESIPPRAVRITQTRKKNLSACAAPICTDGTDCLCRHCKHDEI